MLIKLIVDTMESINLNVKPKDVVGPQLQAQVFHGASINPHQIHVDH